MATLSCLKFSKVRAYAVTFLSITCAIVSSAHSVSAECLPENNANLTRYGNFVVTPDSYDDTRVYSAVVRRLKNSPNTETILDWGYEYTPLDGSWYQSNPSDDYENFIRVTCSETYETPGIKFNSGMGSRDFVAEKLPQGFNHIELEGDLKFFAPKPDAPVYINNVIASGGSKSKVELYRPYGAPNISNAPEGYIAPKEIVAAHIVCYEFVDKSKRPWQRAKNTERTHNHYLDKSKVDQPGDFIVGEWRRIFDGEKLPSRTLENDAGVYHFFTEVLYYYGDKFADGKEIPQAYRYRAARSEIVEVHGNRLGSSRRQKP